MGCAEGILGTCSFRLGASIALAGILLLAATARAEDCGNGVELRLSAPDAAQGTLLLAQIQSAKPLGEVSAKWNERDVPFWQEREKERGASREDVRQALLGVDLEKVAGKYEFTVAGQLQSGERVSCRAMVFRS